MTDKQRSSLMIEWWPNACRVQGWKASNKPLRLRVLSLALNFKFQHVLEFQEALENYDAVSRRPATENQRLFREIDSASRLNNTDDIDAVKNLLFMLADKVDIKDEQGRPEIGQGRRFADVLEQHIRCLALYPLDQPMGIEGAAAYALKIIRQKIPGCQRLADLEDRPGFAITETGRLKSKPSDRQQILFTIAARLNGKTGLRNRAGHSLHDMYIAAGLPCNCGKCRQSAAAQIPIHGAGEPEERFEDLPAMINATLNPF